MSAEEKAPAGLHRGEHARPQGGDDGRRIGAAPMSVVGEHGLALGHFFPGLAQLIKCRTDEFGIPDAGRVLGALTNAVDRLGVDAATARYLLDVHGRQIGVELLKRSHGYALLDTNV